MTTLWQSPVFAECAHQMGIAPLAVLCGLVLRGTPDAERDVGWWWLAGVFGIEWVADTITHLAPGTGWWVSASYPGVQAILTALVLLPKKQAGALVLLVVAASVFLAGFGSEIRPARMPDVEFRAVAWLAIVWIVSEQPWLGRVRTAVLVTFGLGLLVWFLHARVLSLWTWYPYQLVRATGITLFCRAAMDGRPRLRLTTPLARHRRVA